MHYKSYRTRVGVVDLATVDPGCRAWLAQLVCNYIRNLSQSEKICNNVPDYCRGMKMRNSGLRSMLAPAERALLIMTALAAVGAFAPRSTYAQASAPSNSSDQSLEEVVVTGTRIQ